MILAFPPLEIIGKGTPTTGIKLITIEILKIIQSNDIFKGLNNLTEKFRLENWIEIDIISFLCKFRAFISYHSQTKDNESLMDTLNDYIERLENNNRQPQ